MPRLDPGMQSGKIVEWLKKVGDHVNKGEPILVVEGEKTTFEVEAPESGTLTRILAEVGADVQVTQPVAIIGEGGSTATTQAQPSVERTAGPRMQANTEPPRTPAAAPTDRVIASPAARKLAQEHGVNISSIRGTGPGGRITREDVLAAGKTTTPVAVSKSRQATVLRRVPLQGIRKTVAERLSFSARSVVPVTLTSEVDATKVLVLKDQNHISFTALAVKASAQALESHSMLNAALGDEDEIVTFADINVAVAIHTEQGLVAPVIQHANRKSLTEIDSEIEELSRRAKENKLTVEHLTGGTFTVTNLGAYDIESFAPIINPPQCAILGLGRVAFKPVAVGERIVAKPMTILTLVFDHRIVDGVPAARFLQKVKKNLEEANGLV